MSFKNYIEPDKEKWGGREEFYFFPSISLYI